VRPINLIPDEERRSGVVARTGPVAYLIVGALGVLLIGVVMLVLFNNSIHDREGEVARLETEKTAAVAEAQKLSAYSSFKQVSEDRTRTIAELADSRFDWVRVIRQLSLVLPGDVYFESLAASGGGGEEGIAGPSLNITGCADGQPAVAGFVAALKEIDGVTRVELNNSTVNEGSGEGGGGAETPCSKPGVARFEMIVAFDAAPPSPDSAGSTVGESAESEESESSEEGSEEESSEGESSESESSESEGSSSSEGSESSSTQSASAATSGATG
jgi:Tfp pilus assembly protein PilN